ncbi:hypothetical protein FGO68_gene6822 [Halteria grandinella]|uniref:Uncharacterized protein n=1 Tax=Halteria grandinella TaxID=5974 RepID=A0A8J8NRQ4_HALGN|nr:hypothetical protein FGO68_gene6822 [Halteria grandinella]
MQFLNANATVFSLGLQQPDITFFLKSTASGASAGSSFLLGPQRQGQGRALSDCRRRSLHSRSRGRHRGKTCHR